MTMTPPRPGRRLIGLSTKMYFSLSRNQEFIRDFLAHLSKLSPDSLANIDIFIIPDFVSITHTVDALRSSPVPVWTGAQDCHSEDAGAFTGEVSPAVLREAGVQIVEVGHAERRRLFAEDDAVTARKAAAVARNAMLPLVCIGERTEGGVVAVAVEECRVQVEAVMSRIGGDKEVVLAYEPVWAIGADRPAPEERVLEVVAGIRRLRCVRERRAATRIVYGGSAGRGLYARLKSELDGLFIGRFGHDPEVFAQIIQEVAQA